MKSYRLRPITVALIALAVEAAMPAVADAQLRRPGRGRILGGGDFTREVAPDAGAEAVYVRDSATVVERMELADRLGKSGEWDKAADVLQEVLEKQADRLLPLPKAAGDPPDVKRYVGVARAVQDRIAAWPPDGLAAYRARTEAAAAPALDAAGNDVAALNRIFALYYPTDSGKAAGIRLMDLRIEAGEAAAAAWIGERLLGGHPSLGGDRAAVLFRTGLAHQLSGDAAAATEKLKELRAKHAADAGVVAGRETAWADALASAITPTTAPPPPGAPPAVAAAAQSSAWPTVGGNAARAAASAATGRPGARLFGVDLVLPRYRDPQPGQRSLMVALDQADRAGGNATGILPVADGNELFFQDGRRVYAVTLDSGRPLTGWDKTHPGGRFSLGAASGGGVPWGWPRGQQLSLTVTDDAVLAVMGQPDPKSSDMDVTPSDSRLVCLDRSTGAQRWVAQLASTDPAAAGGAANWNRLLRQGVVNNPQGGGGNANAADNDPARPQDRDANAAAPNKSLQLAGAPLVVGDNVYVVGRSDRQQNFEDSYLVCVDLKTGKTRWACYLAGASGNLGYGDPAVAPINASHPAAAGGRVFVCTDLGGVAAVDAFTGNVLWLSTYPRNPSNDPSAAWVGARARMAGIYDTRATTVGKPWAYNPVVVKDGRLFVLPPDGLHLLVYDAGTGAELKRVELSAVRGPDTLLGVVGDRVVMTGDERSRGEANGFAVAVDWRTVDAARPEPAWVKQLPSPTGGPSGVRGRGFIAGDVAYVPTEAKLFAMNVWRDAMAVDDAEYPRSSSRGTWSADGDADGPGNVLVAGEHVVVAGGRRVDVYTDLDLAKARLDRAVAAAPGDPGPRLDYFETLFRAGDVDRALAKLDEAIALMGGRGAMAAGPDRDRVYTAALTFANKLASPAEARAEAGDWAAALFDRAAAAAATPGQQVSYRMARAAMLRTRARDYANVVRLYQEILLDPRLRAVSVAADEAAADATAAGPRPAAVVAEETIADLIKAYGRGVYTAFDLAAGERLDAARAAADPAALLELARTFPNATAAPKALLAAADAYEAGGDHRAAAQVLKELYAKAPQGPARLAVLEGLARNHLARGPGGADRAVHFLTRGAARTDADPALSRELKVPGGPTVAAGTTFRRAADAVAAAAAAAAATTGGNLPQFGVRPWKEQRSTLTAGAAVPDVAQLIVPARPFQRADRVVTWSPGVGVRVFAAADVRQVCARPEVTEAPRSAAWVGDDLLVWTDSTVVRLAPDQDRLVWAAAVAKLPPPEPAVSPDAGHSPGSSVAGGEAEDVDVVDGPVLNPRGQVVRGQRVRMGRNRAPLAVIMRQAQAEADRMAAAAAAGPEQLADVCPAGDRVIVSTTAGRLAGLDFATGAVAWQVRPGDRAPDRLLANDEFVVARVPGDAGSQVVAVDAYAGRPLGRKAFGGGDGSSAPFNLALADDGTLVYTLADRVGAKNLFEPWAEGWRTSEPEPGAPQAFAGAGRSDQLAIANGRVAALAGDGRNVHVLSLLTLRPTTPPLATGTDEAIVGLTLVDDRLYTVSPQKAKSFNLSGVKEVETELRDPRPPSNVVDAFPGKDYFVLLDSMGRVRQPDGSQDRYRILAYSRKTIQGGRESKSLDLSHDVSDDAILQTWQPTDGGLFYMTAGQVLKQVKVTAAERK